MGDLNGIRFSELSEKVNFCRNCVLLIEILLFKVEICQHFGYKVMISQNFSFGGRYFGFGGQYCDEKVKHFVKFG